MTGHGSNASAKGFFGRPLVEKTKAGRATRSNASAVSKSLPKPTPMTTELQKEFINYIPETPEDPDTKAWRNTCLQIMKRGNTKSQKRWRKLDPKIVQAVATPELAQERNAAIASDMLDIVPPPKNVVLGSISSCSDFKIKNTNTNTTRAKTAPEKTRSFFKESRLALRTEEAPYIPIRSSSAATLESVGMTVSSGVVLNIGGSRKSGGTLKPLKNHMSRSDFLLKACSTPLLREKQTKQTKRPSTTPILQQRKVEELGPIKKEALTSSLNLSPSANARKKPGSPVSKRSKTPLGPVRNPRPESRRRRRVLKSGGDDRAFYQREFQKPRTGRIIMKEQEEDNNAWN